MKNFLEYKGYYTRVEYDCEDNVLHGKVEGINDLVNFECDRADQVKEKFMEAVDDYLKFCEDLGVEPEKQFKGTFNVRMSPELHKQASKEAAREGLTLNQFVLSAVESKLQTCGQV